MILTFERRPRLRVSMILTFGRRPELRFPMILIFGRRQKLSFSMIIPYPNSELHTILLIKHLDTSLNCDDSILPYFAVIIFFPGALTNATCYNCHCLIQAQLNITHGELAFWHAT